MSQLRFSLRSGKQFIKSPSNEAALATITSGRHSLFAIYGPSGSGKSHLAGVWRNNNDCDVIEQSDIDRVVREDCPKFVIDGMSTPIEEEKLLHAINHTIERKGKMMITSLTPPATWKIKDPSLYSRLRAIITVEIKQPDQNLLSEMLQVSFRARSWNINETVVRFLANRIHRSGKSADEAAQMLCELSEKEGYRTISTELVKNFFNQEDNSPNA